MGKRKKHDYLKKQTTPTPSPVRKTPLPVSHHRIYSPFDSTRGNRLLVHRTIYEYSFTTFRNPLLKPPHKISLLFVNLKKHTHPQLVLMSEALHRNYQVSEEIGRGRFGVVFRCLSPVNGVYYAVKSIEKSLVSADSLDAQCLLTEPKILHLLSPHPNIINLHDLYEDETHLHMVIDLCSSSDLHHRVVTRRVIPEPESASIMCQLVQALAHCHSLGVAHRDIKPDNILFDDRNRLKLADFGSAEFFKEGQLMSGVVGTPYYVAPEVLAGRDYCEKVDVWSAGVVLYIMLAGFPPFYGDSAVEIFEAVLRANLRFPARVFGSVSSAAKDLLRRMLCKDVSRRFSTEQVLRHPWITSGGGARTVADLT
ncbi:phosphoenolpyruvate carboxylase kinase 1 [Quercus suber]|uniref:Phosphoenolpyruvate carboxylase kinase 1 n=2 Tax=Quercus suber TaxID=58331 RepID=A0AAW0LT40_QUESU